MAKRLYVLLALRLCLSQERFHLASQRDWRVRPSPPGVDVAQVTEETIVHDVVNDLIAALLKAM